MRIRRLAIAAAFVAAANPALAQVSEPAEEGAICLTIGHIWGGTIDDIRRIDAVPVPESFRRQFEAGGCTRFQLIESSLLNWHLVFGTERSATAGLAYIEDGFTARRPSPGDFSNQLSRAWLDALRVIDAARLPATSGPERDTATRRLWRNRAVARAGELVTAHDDFIELTQQYLRAAEYYESAALLEKAEAYWPAVQAGLEVLFRGARVANADFDTGTNGILQPHTHRINQIHDLDMRIAILRARLSRDPADIDAAATVLQRNFDAVLATAADNAEEHSGEFCEFHGEPDQDRLSTLERACDEENSLAARTVNFWRNRAHLDLVMAADPAHYEPQPRQRWEDGSAFARTAAGSNDIDSRGWITSFNTAERLLRNGEFRGIPASWDELPLLLLARADLHARWARALGDSRQSYPAIEQTGRALDYLASAAEITPAHRYPALYRRIAETYLRLWDAPSGDSNDSWRDSTDRRRLAVLLRRTLAALDAITIGDEAGH